MKCLTLPIATDASGKTLHRCVVCHKEARAKSRTRISMQCGVHPPPSGPGSDLAAIFTELRLKAKPGCGCAELVRQMNALGAEGCRRERAALAARLRAKAHLWGWSEQAAAAARAAASGLAFRLDWRDPFGSFIDLAIERAEARNESHRSHLTPPPNCATLEP